MHLFETIEINTEDWNKFNRIDLDIYEFIISSKIPIDQFPFSEDITLGDYNFIFQLKLKKDKRLFDFLFKINVETDRRTHDKNKVENELRNIELTPITKRSYDYLKICKEKSLTGLGISSHVLQKLPYINARIINYFSSNSKKNIVPAKNLMPDFIEHQIFDKDNQNGQPIREILRILDKAGRLDLIPHTHPERKIKQTYWYFKRLD